MSDDVLAMIERLATLRRIELKPGWAEPALGFAGKGENALAEVSAMLGWPTPVVHQDGWRPHHFPLPAWRADKGWTIAERVEGDTVVVNVGGLTEAWPMGTDIRLFELVIPTARRDRTFDKAIDVFKDAIARRKSTLVLAGIATTIINFIALVTSLFSMQVYDRVVPQGAFSTLFALTAGAVIAAIFDLVLRNIRVRMLEREAIDIDTEVSQYFFSRAIGVRLDARPASVGTMAAQLKGMDQVRSMISSSVLFLCADLPFALLFIGIVYAIGGVLVLVMAISFPVSLMAALFFSKMIQDDATRSVVSSNQKNGHLVEVLDAAEVVKSNRGGWFMTARWNKLLDEVHASDFPVRIRQAFAGTAFGTIQQISYVLLIAWGAIEVYERNMTMGGLVACSILAGRINGPLIGQLPNLLVQWSYTKSSLKMLDGILALPQERPHTLDVLRPSRLRPAIAMKDIVFTYPGARQALRIPELKIAAGERVGIIGGIGSGKSTLLRILAGLYAPAEGNILVDGLDMSHIAEDILRQTVGYLPQDSRLVNGSLRDNILLGLSDPGDDLVMRAAEYTGLAGMVANHPRGYDLAISEGGRGLSGGQRTIAALTRMLIARPKLWLLDEPTANLDVDTENRIVSLLSQAVTKDSTLVLVTHKLQLLQLVQRVIVVSNGEVVMDGPRNEILDRLRVKPAASEATNPAEGSVAVQKSSTEAVS